MASSAADTDQPAFGDSHARPVQHDGHVGREPAPTRMGVPVTVKANDAPFVPQLCDRVQHGRGFPKAQERGDVRKFDRVGRMGHLDDSPFDPVIDDRGGKDGLFVHRKRRVRPGHEPRQGESGSIRIFFLRSASWVSFHFLTMSGQSGSVFPRRMTGS
ncbi:MAG TPA: hypothetical protein VHX86_00625 [Tepidisphaeraceae bacterium]|jgi:hypothetical protein|nr:hypothetical protein [Tepidisphaeraceae bacterium]